MADVAYKRYLIRTNPLNGLIWIEKDGTRISFAKSTDDAKRIIDELLSEHTIKSFGKFIAETTYVNVCRKCKHIYGPAGQVPKKCPKCGSTDADVRDDSELIDEDAPANAAGNGGVAGIGIGADGEPGIDLRKKRKKDGDDPLAEEDWMDDGTGHCPKCGLGAHPTDDPMCEEARPIRRFLTVDEMRSLGQKVAKVFGLSAEEVLRMNLVGEEATPDEQFAGADVFHVDTGTFMKSRFGKNRYHRYSKYVGIDETGEAIRQHGRNTKRDIVLKDGTTGAMTFLRRKGLPKLGG